MFSYSFDNETSILSKEKEASAFAAIVMLLTPVRFENLVTISAGLKRINEALFVNAIFKSQVFEDIRCINDNFDGQVDNLSFLIVEIFANYTFTTGSWPLIHFILLIWFIRWVWVGMSVAATLWIQYMLLINRFRQLESSSFQGTGVPSFLICWVLHIVKHINLLKVRFLKEKLIQNFNSFQIYIDVFLVVSLSDVLLKTQTFNFLTLTFFHAYFDSL